MCCVYLFGIISSEHNTQKNESNKQQRAACYSIASRLSSSIDAHKHIRRMLRMPCIRITDHRTNANKNSNKKIYQFFFSYSQLVWCPAQLNEQRADKQTEMREEKKYTSNSNIRFIKLYSRLFFLFLVRSDRQACYAEHGIFLCCHVFCAYHVPRLFTCCIDDWKKTRYRLIVVKSNWLIITLASAMHIFLCEYAFQLITVRQANGTAEWIFLEFALYE